MLRVEGGQLDGRGGGKEKTHALVTAIPTREELNPSYNPESPSRLMTARAAARVLYQKRRKRVQPCPVA
jgi:hypothetical protein